MNRDVAIVLFEAPKKNISVDLEVPLNISASELVVALNTAYNLGIDLANVKECYLKAENPFVLLKGNRTLRDSGVRNGTIIHFTE